MSGHSKWATIKRKKGAIDNERGKIFQKLSMEIIVAAKSGDPNPDNNSGLRMVVDKAKAMNMPKDKIESAIKKACSSGNGENYEEIRYEGYGPHGVAIMVDALTDNKNRTASDVRSTFTKRGGNLGTDGSVSYMFEKKGVIVLPNVYNEDLIMGIAIDNNALDFVSNDDTYEIYTSPDSFISINDILRDNGVTEFLMNEIRFIPNNYIKLSEEQMEKVLKLVDALDDLDDITNVYHNMEE